MDSDGLQKINNAEYESIDNFLGKNQGKKLGQCYKMIYYDVIPVDKYQLSISQISNVRPVDSTGFNVGITNSELIPCLSNANVVIPCFSNANVETISSDSISSKNILIIFHVYDGIKALDQDISLYIEKYDKIDEDDIFLYNKNNMYTCIYPQTFSSLKMISLKSITFGNLFKYLNENLQVIGNDNISVNERTVFSVQLGKPKLLEYLNENVQSHSKIFKINKTVFCFHFLNFVYNIYVKQNEKNKPLGSKDTQDLLNNSMLYPKFLEILKYEIFLIITNFSESI